MQPLLELDASRVPAAILRSPLRNRLLYGGAPPSSAFLEQLLEGAFSMFGADVALAPLQLPFQIIGVPDCRLSAAAILAPQPPLPPKDVVLSSARVWQTGCASAAGLPDALDALWCPPGEMWLGMASSESRARALAGLERPLLAGYIARSLGGSLLEDLAALTGEDQKPESIWGQAIVLEPSEMAIAVLGWPLRSWGVVVLDDEGGRARSEACAGEENLASALGGRAVWPPREGFDGWLPSCEEEIRFVDAIVALARIKPPHPPANWGMPDDDVYW